MPLPALPGPGPTAKVFAKHVGQGAGPSDREILQVLSNHAWALSYFLFCSSKLGIHVSTRTNKFSNKIHMSER